MYTEKQIWQWLEEVCDPELPVLSITDLGMVRKVEISGNNEITISITPTYSGCPAMDMITGNIKEKLLQHGIAQVNIVQSLSPAWTTDWMTESGKAKLKTYGVAPPHKASAYNFQLPVPCPLCNSLHTHRISEFGSTACKALYQCDDCKEPFDYFKCH